MDAVVEQYVQHCIVIVFGHESSRSSLSHRALFRTDNIIIHQIIFSTSCPFNFSVQFFSLLLRAQFSQTLSLIKISSKKYHTVFTPNS